MNLITVGQAKPLIASWVENGVCVDDPRVLGKLNEAVELLMNKEIMKTIPVRTSVCISGNCLTTPRNVNTVLAVRLDGCFADVYSRFYEFMSNGPGLAEYSCSYYQDLLEVGWFPTQYDLHANLKLLVLAELEEDNGTEIIIRGIDQYGKEVRFAGAMGEAIPAHKDGVRYTSNVFHKITSVTKPVTKGYIYIYAFDPDTDGQYLIAYYHPDDVNPTFRRYQLKGQNFTCQEDDDGNTLCLGQTRCADALVKLRYLPLHHDSDVIPVPSMAAIRRMIQAIGHYDSDDPEKGAAFEGVAERYLTEAVNSDEQLSDEINVQTEAWGMGGIETVSV